MYRTQNPCSIHKFEPFDSTLLMADTELDIGIYQDVREYVDMSYLGSRTLETARGKIKVECGGCMEKPRDLWEHSWSFFTNFLIKSTSYNVKVNIFSISSTQQFHFFFLIAGKQTSPPLKTLRSVIVYLEDILQLRRLMAQGVAVRNVKQCYHCLGIWTR